MTTENIIENSEEMEEDNDNTKELDQQLMVQFTSETGNLYSKLSKGSFLAWASMLSKVCHVNEFNYLIL